MKSLTNEARGAVTTVNNSMRDKDCPADSFLGYLNWKAVHLEFWLSLKRKPGNFMPQQLKAASVLVTGKYRAVANVSSNC